MPCFRCAHRRSQAGFRIVHHSFSPPHQLGREAPVPCTETVIITRHQRPVAQLRPFLSTTPQPIFGNCQGMLTIVAEDDEHREDFHESML